MAAEGCSALAARRPWRGPHQEERSAKGAAPAEILAHLYGGRTSRIGEAARGPVQHGLQSLGLHVVGEHDLLNE